MKTTISTYQPHKVSLIAIGICIGFAIAIAASIFDAVRSNNNASSEALRAAAGLCPGIEVYTPGSLPITNAQLHKIIRRCMQDKELKDASFASLTSVRDATRQCPGVESDLPVGSMPITRVQLSEILTRCMQNKEIAELAELSRLLR
jgi:hypothetical protein